jgi:aminopeptidase N
MLFRAFLVLLSTLFVTQPPATRRLRYVDLRITLLPATHAIAGEARLVVDPQPGDLVLDLSDSMTVDSVSTGTFQRLRGAVHVPMGETRGMVLVVVWYHGTPSARALAFTDHDGTTRVATYGLPNSAREWWPTLDDPYQKADSADIRVTAPAALTIVSNGRLVDRSSEAHGQVTTHWAVRYPIYSDVISLGAADYVVRHGRAGKVPLEFYVFPEDSAKADTDFTVVPRVLLFYAQLLGPYPFTREKYGIAEFSRRSFREHQTIPSFGAFFITGKHEHDQIIAHEIAHQWFGNSLTVAGWRDIWLNESFSEYMAWRFMRADRGDTAFASLVAEAKAKQYTGTIARADSGGFATMFGDLTFEKGPLVLTMLEQQIGTRAMDQALRDYVRTHAYGLASQQDFQRLCERYSGKSLDAFFTRWVAGTDQP